MVVAVVDVVLLGLVWPRGCAVLGRFGRGFRCGSAGVGCSAHERKTVVSRRADWSLREREKREAECGGT